MKSQIKLKKKKTKYNPSRKKRNDKKQAIYKRKRWGNLKLVTVGSTIII